MDAGLAEVARLLALRPPFAALAPAELGELVAQAELEFYAAGAAILTEDGGPVTFLRVIHSGAVDIVHDERLLDLLGAGDTFGHDAMLAGLPPGFAARAAQDTLCYRIPVAVARPLLDRARDRELTTVSGDPGHRAVATLIRSATVCVRPEDTVEQVARQMTDAQVSAAIVELADGEMGIVTDRDLRSRVLAAGLAADAKVAQVMTTPVFTVTPDRLGGEVLFELLERGVHHVPVVTESGRLVGIIEDGDLMAVRQRAWFGARGRIGRAPDPEALTAAAHALPALIADLHAAQIGAVEIARVRSALIDAVVVRALELAAAQAAPGLPDGLVWVALGPHARRELTPATPPLGAVICDVTPPPGLTDRLGELLVAVGLAPDPPVRTSAQWAAGAEEPVGLSVLTDRRVLYGTPVQPLPLLEGPSREPALARLKAAAQQRRAPTGFAAEAVVAAGGELAEHLDLQATALEPIGAIARWAGAAAGQTAGTTPERLQSAADAGVISAAAASELADAFSVVLHLTVTHEIGQLAAGRPAQAPLDPAGLPPFARDELRHVFRTIAAAQRRLPQAG